MVLFASMQPAAEARLTDELLAQRFQGAHASLQKAAVEAVRHEGMPAGTDTAIVRFTGETHSITMHVTESEIAQRGLWSRLWSRFRRPPASVQAYATIHDRSQPDQAAVILYLDAVRSGCDMLSPSITGWHDIPSTPASQHHGSNQDVLEDHLETAISRLNYEPPAVTSRTVLEGAVAALCRMPLDHTVRSVEHPSQRHPAINFIGNEQAQMRSITLPFFQEDMPALIRGAKEYPHKTLRLTDRLNNQDDLTDDCAIDITASAAETTIQITPNPIGIWRDLPPLRLTGPTLRADRDQCQLGFYTPEGNTLALTRTQREQLLMLLGERFRREDFYDVVSEKDVIQPDEAVLQACEQLAGDEAEPRFYSWFAPDDTPGNVRRIAVQRDAGGYSVLILGDQDKAPQMFFMSGGSIISQYGVSAGDILNIYDALQALAKQQRK